MDTTLQTNTIACYKKGYTSVCAAEETGETVVPDRMPDIGMIANTGACVLLRSKEATDGNVTMQGEIQVSVLYIPDGESGLRALSVSLPCTASFDSPEITQECIPVGTMRVCGVEARLLNPRKILVKAEVVTELTCFIRGEASYCKGESGSVGSLTQLHCTTAKFSTVAAVCERTFVVADEYALPSSAAGGEVVRKNVQFRVEDVKTIANKLIVKGTVLSEVLYATETGIETASFGTVFSQIVETDSEDITPDARVSLMPTGMYYEVISGENGPTLSVELHGVCQVAVMAQHEIEFVSDAFSNRCACDVEYSPINVVAQSRASTQRETVRDTIPCKSAVSQVRFATCTMGKVTVSGDTVNVRVDVELCVAYENGVDDCVSRRMEVNFQGDGEAPSILSADVVRCTDVYAIPSGNGVEIRFAVEADLRTETVCELETVCAIHLDEEHPCVQDRPSLTVVRGGGSLWELARKYGSTVDLIRQINELEDDIVPQGSVLFVPRERF